MEQPEYLKDINREISEMYRMNADIYRDVQVLLEGLDPELVRSVCERTRSVILLEEKIVDRCVEALIRHQPFAGDLRALTSAMRVAYDLARVSRYLTNIMQVLRDIGLESACFREVKELLHLGWEMVSDGVSSYLSRDPVKAESVIKQDANVDAAYREILSKCKGEREGGGCALLNGLLARIIERMADHGCYISAETIYAVTGIRVGVRAPKCPSHS